MSWIAPGVDIPSYLLTRDGQLAFQLRPAGAPKPLEPESRLRADYLEVRIRYDARPP